MSAWQWSHRGRRRSCASVAQCVVSGCWISTEECMFLFLVNFNWQQSLGSLTVSFYANAKKRESWKLGVAVWELNASRFSASAAELRTGVGRRAARRANMSNGRETNAAEKWVLEASEKSRTRQKLELFPTKCLCVGLSTSAVTYRPANVEKPPVQIYKCDYSPLSVAGKREWAEFFLNVFKKFVLHQEGDLCSVAFFHVVKRRVLLQTTS